jgi:hypothetical protein
MPRKPGIVAAEDPEFHGWNHKGGCSTKGCSLIPLEEVKRCGGLPPTLSVRSTSCATEGSGPSKDATSFLQMQLILAVSEALVQHSAYFDAGALA